MGVLVLLPFLVIDLAISSILMSLGMMMVPPSTISLPIKLLLFVVVDGWHLLVGSLVRSFG
jgi:flagellar biosynthetic protein FliP